jgi:hypothetical protein
MKAIPDDPSQILIPGVSKRLRYVREVYQHGDLDFAVRSNADQGRGLRWRLGPENAIGALLLNGAWGLGVALLMRLLNRVSLP